MGALNDPIYINPLVIYSRSSASIRNEKLRLVRINAPEMTGPDKALGMASRDFLRGLIDRREIIIETVKDQRGKYGRYLATSLR